MTQSIVWGVVATEDGLARNETRAWATPAALVAATQDRVEIDIEHNHRAAGEGLYFERNAGRVWLVAHVRDVGPFTRVKVGAELVLVESDHFWSGERLETPEGQFLYRSVSLTSSPARVCPGPALRWLPGRSLDWRREIPGSWGVAGFDRALLERAAVYHADHRRDDTLRVIDRDAEVELERAIRSGDKVAAIAAAEDQAWKLRLEHAAPVRGSILRVS